MARLSGVLVDLCDEPLLWEYRWKVRRDGYVVAWHQGRVILLHRLIMDAPADMVVDHLNGDPSDNRRANLRVCTHAENRRNHQGVRGGKRSSRFHGVGWWPRDAKWRARLMVDGREVHVGYFDTEEEAARARDIAACEHFGEFAALNFPEAFA